MTKVAPKEGFIIDEAGRRVGTQTMTCDYCGFVDHLRYRTSHLPDDVVRAKFVQRGWEAHRKAACPKCVQKFKAASAAKGRDKMVKAADPGNVVPIKEMAQLGPAVAAAGGVREMGASDRRRVFRAIDEAWDENRGRYAGNATDHMIAETLDVPRLWVEEIRHESFGLAGDNDAMEALEAKLTVAVGQVAGHVDQALAFAGKFETLLKEMRAMQAELQKIKQAAGPKR